MSSADNTGLAWPDHDSGPSGPESEQRNRPTRKPLSFWDRSKFILLLGSALVVFTMADREGYNAPSGPAGTGPGIKSFNESINDTLRAKWWIVALLGLELLRQAHYLISEHSAGYHRFWTQRIFGAFERRMGRMGDWNRYRLSRVLKFLLVLVLVDLLVAKIQNVSPATAILRIPVVAFQALPMALQMAMYFFIIVFQFLGLFWFLSRGGTEVYFPDDIKTRFSDVWGQDAVLERVKENMLFLDDPDSIEAKGGYVPGGLLLWGPPGTGKTLMAEAVAGETGKPFVFVDPGAFINMFFGVGILKVKSLFRKLRKLAVRYGAVIVFFDEADSLGNRGQLQPGGAFPGGANGLECTPACNGTSYLSRETATQLFLSSLSHSGGEARPGIRNRIIAGMGGGGGGMGTLQALLTELSGLKKPRGFFNRVVRRTLGLRPKPPPKYRILVMMATNMPQALDEALLRPGRIDRIYRVGYPSKEGRRRTYEGYLNKVSHNLTPEQIDKLATITPYATGATIKDLVNEALIVAIREGGNTITWRDMMKAKLLKSLGPPDDVEYIERERHAVAVHEACHAVAAYRVREHLEIDIATIEKGQTYLGMVASIPLEEQFTQWRSEYEADMVVALASLAGERMFFDGDNSSGVSGDLQSSTTVAMFMESHWGMGETIGSHATVKPPGGGPAMAILDGTSRNLLDTPLGHRIEERLQAAMVRAQELLAENRREVLAVAHALETHKTLTGEDVEAIIEGRTGPLVDGTPYASDEFPVVAEAYHARAVEAHKSHGKVQAALPVLNGHRTEAQLWRREAGVAERPETEERNGSLRAVLRVTPASGPAPLNVTFDGSHSGAESDPPASPAAWRLTFGDGGADATGRGAPPAALFRTYAEPGVYTAVLTVSDASGAGMASEEVVIAVDAGSTERAPEGGEPDGSDGEAPERYGLS